jgi:hypothetical protein
MELSKILSIAGKPGLYQILHQSRGGVVVASLADGKKMSIGQTQRVSTLSDISVYKVDGDEPLEKIFDKMLDYNGGKPLDVELKDNNSLRAFFLEILPEHDEERVYTSDIKKLVKWFNTLVEKGLLEKSVEKKDPVKDETSDEEDATKPKKAKAAKPAAEKPAASKAKAAAPKAAAPKAVAPKAKAKKSSPQ